MYFSVNRRLSAFAVGLFVSLPILGQQTGAPAPAPSTPPSGAGSAPTAVNPGTNTRGTYGNIPTNRFPGTQSPNRMPQTYFFSGRVQLDDGNRPNNNIRIERVCGTNVRLETHTDSRGQFSFQLGQNMAVDMDASTNSFPGPAGSRGMGGGGFDNGDFGGGMRGGLSGDPSMGLWNCELRASYPGYHSDIVRLAGRQPLDPPDVGTIVLHHLGNAGGTTISLTTALAPKNAQKAFQKGTQLAEKGKIEEAQQKLKEATELYPKYAIAWYALGQTQQRSGQAEDARKSYQSAIDADSRYVNPYDQLARLAAQAGKWQEAAEFSRKAIGLNPVEFPSSLWYNAVASYQLKNAKDAERSTRDLLKLDTRHNFPQAENLMGQLLLERGDYTEAATHLKNYLALAPNAENAAAIRQALSKMDGGNALNKSAPAPAGVPAPAPPQP